MAKMIFTIGLLAASALASPLSTDVPQGKFSQPIVGQLTWVGEVFPGVNYTFEGEAQDIYKQILAVNPSYVAKKIDVASPLKRDLVARNKQDNGWCGNFRAGDKNDFNSEACYLNSIGGYCSVNPRTCIRMACQSFSGAFLCNDRTDKISPSCAYLASYVTDITGSCYSGTTPAGQAAYMSGQEFDTDNYNVVLSGSNCSAPASAQPTRVTSGGPPQKTCNGASGCIQLHPPQC